LPGRRTLKVWTVVLNSLALVTLAVLLVVGPMVADLGVRLRLTDLDRNQCFNREKLKSFSHGIDDPRGTEMSGFLTGSWRENFTLAGVIGVLTNLLTLLLQLVPPERSLPRATNSKDS
jgi:hypothetical protein